MNATPTAIDADFVDLTPARLPVVKVNRLPTTITNERINAATLPTVISAAQRAIARCTDLPQLLEYRDKAEGLAAAVRIMRDVGPDMVRKANEMMADAWRKGGELLSEYSSAFVIKSGEGRTGHKSSPRSIVAEGLGIKKHEAMAMVRLAKASPRAAYLAAQKTPNVTKAARLVPAVGNPYGAIGQGSRPFSDALRGVMHGSVAGNRAQGLTAVINLLTRVPLECFVRLSPDERKMVKAKITEIMELLDEMDRLCK